MDRVRPRLRFAAFFGGQCIHAQSAAAMPERHLERLDYAAALDVSQAETVDHHPQPLAFACCLFFLYAGEPGSRQPLFLFLRRKDGWQFGWKRYHQTRIGSVGAYVFCRWGCVALVRPGRKTCGPLLQVCVNAVRIVVPHRQRGLAVEQVGKTGKKQLEVVVELRHGAHGRARSTYRVGLVDGNGRWHAFDLVHGGLVHAVEKLPRIGAEGFHITPLAFGVERVEHQAGFARAAWAGHHRQFPGSNVHIQIAQVILARAANADQGGGRGVFTRRPGLRVGRGRSRRMRHETIPGRSKTRAMIMCNCWLCCIGWPRCSKSGRVFAPESTMPCK